jgi:hypothetical protein
MKCSYSMHQSQLSPGLSPHAVGPSAPATRCVLQLRAPLLSLAPRPGAGRGEWGLGGDMVNNRPLKNPSPARPMAATI